MIVLDFQNFPLKSLLSICWTFDLRQSRFGIESALRDETDIATHGDGLLLAFSIIDGIDFVRNWFGDPNCQ